MLGNLTKNATSAAEAEKARVEVSALCQRCYSAKFEQPDNEIVIAREVIRQFLDTHKQLGAAGVFKAARTKELRAAYGLLGEMLQTASAFLGRPVPKDPVPELRAQIAKAAREAIEASENMNRAVDAVVHAWEVNTPSRASAVRGGAAQLWRAIRVLVAERDAARAEVEMLRAKLDAERNATGLLP